MSHTLLETQVNKNVYLLHFEISLKHLKERLRITTVKPKDHS